MTAVLRTRHGSATRLPLERWVAPPGEDEEDVLALAIGPVLDVGCGPGRHALALGRRGVMALGVDVSADAVALAHARGVTVLHRSVFDRLPGEGRWGSALLLDGNIGIGGDPVTLLGRLRELVRANGRVLAELSAPGTGTACLEVRVENGDDLGPWFAWAHVSVDDAHAVGHAAGLALERAWASGGRWFAAWRR